jgi:hypothetical protein
VQWLVKQAAMAFYPRTEALPGVEDTALDAQLDQLRTEGPPILWVTLVLGALLFATTPLFTVGVPLPAFFLPRAWLDKHAHRLATTRFYLLRQAMLGLKVAASLAWGKDPAVRAAIGMRPYADDPERFRVT